MTTDPAASLHRIEALLSRHEGTWARVLVRDIRRAIDDD